MPGVCEFGQLKVEFRTVSGEYLKTKAKKIQMLRFKNYSQYKCHKELINTSGNRTKLIKNVRILH